MQQRGIETLSSIIRIDQEGILRLRIKDGYDVKLEDVKESFEVYKKLGCDKKKVLQLMEGSNFFTFDNTAQKYAAKHCKDFFIASALVNKSLGIRILFNFFNRFFNAGIPFKMFSTEQEALKWLRKFKEK